MASVVKEGVMRVFEINTVPYGSTAKIMVGISEIANSNGIETYVSSGYSSHPMPMPQKYIKIGSALDKLAHKILSEITGKDCCFSYFSTKTLIRKIDKLKIDVLHLHNLHSYFINLSLLFNYIKRKNLKVIWTLHDCWSFTGHCPHFTMVECDKWKYGCYGCPQYKEYPKSWFDNSKKMWQLKKKWFTGVKDLTIVTPSLWLANLVKQSFLKDYPVKVINNGIDLSIFKPTESDFREKYEIGDKFIVLGVAFGWGKRKGLDVFIELSKRLDKEKYQIVLVGTDCKVDKILPENIISIHRTQNQTELAEIYTAADVFFNPTREEVLGLVNIEANACGTPVVMFDTGGAPECIDNKSGVVVKHNDIQNVVQEINEICERTPFLKEDCVNRAKEFDMNIKNKEYVNLYSELCGYE